MSNHIALVFDFDDTLVDEAVSQFLRNKKIDPKKLWDDMSKRVSAGWDPTLAYLDLFVDMLEPGNPLAGVTREELSAFGSTLAYYPGIPELFNDLREDVQKLSEKHKIPFNIEYYIISGGLKPIIEGAPFKDQLTDFWACDFVEDPILKPCKTVSFTEKTKFMYLINKGFVGEEFRNVPDAVNIPLDKADRKIPFPNVIYIGDGETDIPCFSMLREYKGHPFLVLPVTRTEDSKARLKAFNIARRRFIPVSPADYSKGSALRMNIDMTIDGIITRAGKRFYL